MLAKSAGEICTLHHLHGTLHVSASQGSLSLQWSSMYETMLQGACPCNYMQLLRAVAALIGLQNQAEAALIQPVSAVPQSGRVLFIGLGGGSMPLFLSHAFPGLAIDITEIDATVIKAASEIIGFPLDRHVIRPVS